MNLHRVACPKCGRVVTAEAVRGGRFVRLVSHMFTVMGEPCSGGFSDVEIGEVITPPNLAPLKIAIPAEFHILRMF